MDIELKRESDAENNLFFLCSLIVHIARSTHNRPGDVASILGEKYIKEIYSLADILHCENIDEVRDRYISRAGISSGSFDNTSEAAFRVPSIWEQGRTYEELIWSVCGGDEKRIPADVIEVFTSSLSDKLEDYSGTVYFSSPQALLYYYTSGTASEY